MTDVYYRFVDDLVGTGGFDADGEYSPGPAYVRVQVLTYDVIKKTPRGAWINGPEGRQFIADRWYQKFANSTLEGARADFVARKERLISIQSRRIRNAEEAIRLAKANQARSLFAGEIKIRPTGSFSDMRLL